MLALKVLRSAGLAGGITAAASAIMSNVMMAAAMLGAAGGGPRQPATGGPTQNSAYGQISVSEKAEKCMENEKVLRMRISAEK